jgi:hypothetical protein
MSVSYRGICFLYYIGQLWGELGWYYIGQLWGNWYYIGQLWENLFCSTSVKYGGICLFVCRFAGPRVHIPGSYIGQLWGNQRLAGLGLGFILPSFGLGLGLHAFGLGFGLGLSHWS